jgi:ATP-dependent Clp protease ATP-binding subunit ClpA
MFERFTKRARASLVLAQAEAVAFGHNFLGTEHIVLGMLAEGEGIAAKVLTARGLALEGAREAVEEMLGRGSGGAPPVADAEALAAIGIDLDAITNAVEAAFGKGALDRARSKGRRLGVGGVPFVPRAKKALELSLREALALGHNYIGTEHLLLGVVRLNEGVGYDVIKTAVADPVVLRQDVIAELSRLRPGA